MPHSFPLELLLLALAAYRTTRLVLTDTITKRFRDWWYVRFPPPHLVIEAREQGGDWVPLKAHPLGTLFSCSWCLGFWIALAWSGAYWAWPVATVYLALPLALSVVVGKLSERD